MNEFTERYISNMCGCVDINEHLCIMFENKL